MSCRCRDTGPHGSITIWTGWTDLGTPEALYRNVNGTLTYVDGRNFIGTWGDFNNDGYPDNFNYAHRILLQNDTQGGFFDVSHMLLSLPAVNTQAAV